MEREVIDEMPWPVRLRLVLGVPGGPVFLIANRLAITVASALSWEGNTAVSYESSYWLLTVHAFIWNQFTEHVVRYLFCLPALKPQ